jgi:cytochrome b6-f complex iron-sulfur subunit
MSHAVPASCTLATRRGFVCGAARALAGGMIAGAAAPLIEACAGAAESAKPHAFEATFDVSGLTEDGRTIVAPSAGPDGAPILLVRRSARGFVALSMLCTHEGCPLNLPVGGLITCPCHGSQFELDGKVHRGPAQLSLTRYSSTYDMKAKRLTVFADE